MSAKPTVYVDANILSMLFYEGYDPNANMERIATRDWWALERPLFHVWCSKLTVSELSAGKYCWQEAAMREVRRLPALAYTAPVKRCEEMLFDERIVPPEKPADAVHLAFATVHAVDYLLTWNHAHLSNVATQERLNRICRRGGWRSPRLVSPDTIPKAALGQEISRRHEEKSH